jgi:hypothetical protein
MSGEAKTTPSAEPALTVGSREDLVYLLGQACEIEHGLMCEYLYAQFSLKRGLDEGLTEAHLARVQAWEKALISVIKQEMLHLALATNILTAVGAAPEFDTLARTAKHLMNWVMRELGPVLTGLPVGPSHPGRTAGPTFDIARPAIFLLPHQDAAWKIIKERLDALERACTSLGQQADLGALAPLAGQLHSMSQNIETHIPKTAARPQRPGTPADRHS